MSYLDKDGVLYFWQKIKSIFATQSDLDDKVDKVSGKGLSTNDYTTAEKEKLAAFGAASTYATKTDLNGKVDKVSGKGLSTNDYTTTEKNKLAGIAAGAEVNQNAYSTVSFGGSLDVRPFSLAADSKTDTITVNFGSNVYVSDFSESDNSLTLEAVDTTYENATTSAAGLMSSEDKTKLNAFGAASTYATQTDLSGKVDKVSGKGLSTNDYTTAEKNKLAAFGAASTYALKTDIAGMYKYKGSVASVSALPASGNTAGDVYNIEASGMNYAWDGEAWDALGEIFTITAVTNAEIDTIVAS